MLEFALVVGAVFGFLVARDQLRKSAPTQSPVRTRSALQIRETTPAVLTERELRQHGLNPRHFSDARFFEGPVATLDELPADVRGGLDVAFQAGLARGPRIAQLLGGKGGLDPGESVIFVLLEPAGPGFQLCAYVAPTPKVSPVHLSATSS